MSIVNVRPFYKRMGQDVIKSLLVEYMPQLTLWEVWEKMIYIKFTSTGGLRGNKFYLTEIVNGIVCLYVTMVCLLWTTERAKERNSSCL